MFARVIWDLHDVEFEAHVALPDGVDAGYVRTLLSHRLHKLQGEKEKLEWKVLKGLNVNFVSKDPGICFGGTEFSHSTCVASQPLIKL